MCGAKKSTTHTNTAHAFNSPAILKEAYNDPTEPHDGSSSDSDSDSDGDSVPEAYCALLGSAAVGAIGLTNVNTLVREHKQRRVPIVARVCALHE
jgi:hypothetical protein